MKFQKPGLELDNLMKLSIIIPAHNEEKTIGQVISKVMAVDLLPWEKEIVVVNDGSSDNTKDILEAAAKNFRQAGLKVLHHASNLGKGAAVQSALRQVAGEYVIIQDADGEYDPKDIPGLLEPINRHATGTRVVVFGDRGIKSYPERGIHYVIGAKILTWTLNLLFGVKLSDLYTGYKLIPADIFKSLNIKSAGFEFEAEVACKLLKKGIKIAEVPIANYRPRSKRQGKHIRAKDAIIGLWAIIKYRFTNEQ